MDAIISLEAASATGRWDKIASSVHETVRMLIDSWLSPSGKENIDNILQICVQNLEAATADRELTFSPDYYFGQLEGTLQVLDKLRIAEKRREELIREAAKGSKKFNDILQQLYASGQRGMRHGDLAEAVGSSPASLSGIMKRVLHSGAVTASRSGKNTHYILSEEGRKFWEELNAPIKPDAMYEFMAQSLAQLADQNREMSRRLDILCRWVGGEDAIQLRTEPTDCLDEYIEKGTPFHMMYQGRIEPNLKLSRMFRVNQELYAHFENAMPEQEWRFDKFDKLEK